MRFAAAEANKKKKRELLPPPVNRKLGGGGGRSKVVAAGGRENAKLLHRLKVDATRCVGHRETLLMQLNAVVLHWPTSQPTTADRLLVDLSRELRKTGLRCVEKIVAWVLRQRREEAAPAPFYWNGKDYLLKMADDLDFVAETIGSEAA